VLVEGLDVQPSRLVDLHEPSAQRGAVRRRQPDGRSEQNGGLVVGQPVPGCARLLQDLVDVHHPAGELYPIHRGRSHPGRG